MFPRLRLFLNFAWHRFGHFSAELLIAPWPSGATQEGELTGQPALFKKLKESGHKLSMGEIAAGAHRAFAGNHRHDVVLEQPGQPFEQFPADPRDAATQRHQAHQHHRAGGLDVDLCILDVGLTAEQVNHLRDLATSVVSVDWEFDFPGRDKTPGYFKAMTSRPYLPRHFPGYDLYMWIDSDAWVQDASVLETYLRSAAAGQLAVVPEIDRGYTMYYKRPKPYWRHLSHRMYRWGYGWKIADRLGRNPILNSVGKCRERRKREQTKKSP